MSNVNLKTDFKNGDKLYAEQLNNNFGLIKEAFAKGATGDVVWQDGTTVKFRRHITTDIEQLPILDGAIIYDIQKGRNYIDYDGKRIQVGSAGNEVIIGEESEITEDTKLIIEQEFIDNIGTEVVNSLEGNETNKAPSVALFNNKFANIVNLFYPIGSIYMSVNSTNPSTLFGGTWEQLKDRFLLGAGSTYSNGDTGGSATHKLTVNEMPAHTHNGLYWQGTKGISLNSGGTSGYHLQWESGDNGEATDMVTNTRGGSKAHNNMPPYLVVYMWKRTA